jgi:uracil-DNA glycosylase family 4
VQKIGENIQIRRAALVQGDVVATYTHGLKIGVAVALTGGDAELGRDVAMHIAASNPMVINPADVPADILAREQEIYAAKARESGKPDNIVEKMIEGSLKIKKEEVYTTNLVKCRGTKEASFQNFESCNCYLLKQIEVIKPKIIVAVGERVHDYLLKSSGEFLKNRGKVLSFNSAILVPIFSPLYLLKNPSLKKDTYLDMLKIKNLYEES